MASDNYSKGKDFQIILQKVLSNHFGVEFEMERPFLIGNPAKEHRFDLVSTDSKIIVEVKNYTWTESGLIPSAKISILNETVFFLQHTPKDHTKILLMRSVKHPKKNETLAQHYVGRYGHLLNGVKVMEYNQDIGELIEVV